MPASTKYRESFLQAVKEDAKDKPAPRRGNQVLVSPDGRKPYWRKLPGKGSTTEQPKAENKVAKSSDNARSNFTKSLVSLAGTAALSGAAGFFISNWMNQSKTNQLVDAAEKKATKAAESRFETERNKIESDYQQKISGLTQEYDEKLKNSGGEAEELKKLVKEKDDAIASVTQERDTLQNQLDETQKAHEKELKSLQDGLSSGSASFDEYLAADADRSGSTAARKLKDAISAGAALEGMGRKELKTELDAFKEKAFTVIDEHDRKFREEAARADELEKKIKSLETEYETARKEGSDNVNQLQTDLELERNSHEKARKNISDMRKSHAQEVNTLQSEFETKLKKETDDLSAKHTKKVAELEGRVQEAESAILDAEKSYETKLVTEKSRIERELKRKFDNDLKEEVIRLSTEKEQELTKARDDIRKEEWGKVQNELATMREAHAQEMAQAISTAKEPGLKPGQTKGSILSDERGVRLKASVDKGLAVDANPSSQASLANKISNALNQQSSNKVAEGMSALAKRFRDSLDPTTLTPADMKIALASQAKREAVFSNTVEDITRDAQAAYDKALSKLHKTVIQRGGTYADHTDLLEQFDRRSETITKEMNISIVKALEEASKIRWDSFNETLKREDKKEKSDLPEIDKESAKLILDLSNTIGAVIRNKLFKPVKVMGIIAKGENLEGLFSEGKSIYEYSIGKTEISYLKLGSSERKDSYRSDRVSKGTKTKKPECEIGTPCGNSCQPKGKKCKQPLSQAESNAIDTKNKKVTENKKAANALNAIATLSIVALYSFAVYKDIENQQEERRRYEQYQEEFNRTWGNQEWRNQWRDQYTNYQSWQTGGSQSEGYTPPRGSGKSTNTKPWNEVLGVDKNASPDKIKKAYRKKAMENHPDRAGSDEAKKKENTERMQEINNAFDDYKKTQKKDSLVSIEVERAYREAWMQHPTVSVAWWRAA
jgi:hypothetical protein